MSHIFKIVTKTQWSEAEAAGLFRGSPVDHQDGFIHFSTETQVVETAGKHFAGQADLVLFAVSPADLGEALRWEPSRGGALFPHLYAALPTRLIAWFRPLPLGSDGRHDFSGLLP